MSKFELMNLYQQIQKKKNMCKQILVSKILFIGSFLDDMQFTTIIIVE